MQDNDFIIVENVPVFDETSGYGEEDLQRIADNNNRRIADTGDEVPLIIGHTGEGSAEEENEVVGYATNFRLGIIGKVNPRRAILATFKYFKDKWEKARNFQRRSVELWPEPDLFIDPIALLGPHTPHCDLGLTPRIAYEKKGKRIVCTLEENSGHKATYRGGSMENSELFVKEIYDKLAQSEEFAFIRQLMKERAEKAESDEDEKKEPEKHAEDEKVEDKDEEKDEKYRLAKDQLTGQVERYRREAEATRKELETIQRKFRRVEREKDFVRLEANEGIIFDLAEELDEVQDMTPEQYGRHLDKMRRRYQRIPDGTTIKVANPEPAQNKTFTMDDAYKAVELTKTKNISYEQAVALIKEGNAK